MTKHQLNENLLHQLSLTQLALSRLILQGEYSVYKPRAKTVSRNWLKRANRLSEEEWTAGAQSLVVYFSIYEPARLSAVESILMPFHKAYSASRSGKSACPQGSSIEIEQAKEALADMYLNMGELRAEPEIHGARRGWLTSCITNLWRGKRKS